MKKHLLFVASAIMALTAFTSCQKQDNAVEPDFKVVTFENQKLNDLVFASDLFKKVKEVENIGHQQNT